MKLTLNETIENHKKMWNWIADETERVRYKITKKDYMDEFIDSYSDIPEAFCYACHYAHHWSKGSRACRDNCPFVWERTHGPANEIKCHKSIFGDWVDTDPCDWERAAKLARQIANLPLTEKAKRILEKEKINMNSLLTLKETVEKHRKLWNWIADETEKQKRIVKNAENPMVQKDEPLNDCYCCEFVFEQYGHPHYRYCDKCPLNWGKSQDLYHRCLEFDTLYDLWCDILNDDIVFENEAEKLKEAVRVARKIANLPLKPEYQKMYDEEISKLMEKN